MKTIKMLIAEKQGYLRAQREINLEDSIRSTYIEFPELKKFDDDLFKLNKNALLAKLDGKDELLYSINKNADNIREERDSFIKKNNISPFYNEPTPVCSKCSDTGFITTPNGMTAVCTSCMMDELKECFNANGMRDYPLFKLKSFDLGYFGDKKSRKEKYDRIKSIFEKNDYSNPVQIYSDKIQSGKSYLSVVLVKSAIIEGKSAAYLRAEDFASIDNDDNEFCKKCDFLVIDDYAPEVSKRWNVVNNLNQVLDVRTASNLPTLIVSPFTKKELVDESDMRISGKLLNAEII